LAFQQTRSPLLRVAYLIHFGSFVRQLYWRLLMGWNARQGSWLEDTLLRRRCERRARYSISLVVWKIYGLSGKIEPAALQSSSGRSE
jgi:hypothetical protein